MKSSSFFARAAVVLGCLGFAAAGARGQGVWNYASIYSFGSKANDADGASPQGGVVVSPDGKTLYGTTYAGGKFGQGTVFAFTVPSGPLKTLWDFGNVGQDGAGPKGNLVLANGILYGTTYSGGPGTKGVVYCVGADGQTPPYHWLHNWSGGSYSGGAHDGASPSYAGLTLSSDGSTLYGTTSAGGDNGNGTVFAISINGDGTAYQLLHQFTVGFNNDGVGPRGGCYCPPTARHCMARRPLAATRRVTARCSPSARAATMCLIAPSTASLASRGVLSLVMGLSLMGA